MKAGKIIIPVTIVLAIVAFFVYLAVRDSGVYSKYDDIEIIETENQYVNDILQKISILDNAPVNVFSVQSFTNIDYDINDTHAKGFFGDTDYWKNILSRRLFVVYTTKYISQAKYVFERSEWTAEALQTIRSENRKLQNSDFINLAGNEEPRNELRKISEVLRLYDEITDFVVRCRNFSYLRYDLNNQFPIDDVKNMIAQAQTYRNRRELVRNCTRLQNDLAAAPTILFNAHVSYLNEKIRRLSAVSLENFHSQRHFMETLYTPFVNQINSLNNSDYGIDAGEFNNRKRILTENWQKIGGDVSERLLNRSNNLNLFN